ncbi:MAG: hypothetical protein MAGBODY4_00343 [Candidatus Marinimicrobia bacterium]|nr:hypothetical protein [Candidatus Neomarinimicrobiota bacterium]
MSSFHAEEMESPLVGTRHGVSLLNVYSIPGFVYILPVLKIPPLLMSKFSIQAYQDKRGIEWDAATDQERTVLRRRITATDREIDQLVYALYDLTENEIAIVKGRVG